ncbi:MAG: GNAT family N-acetyltransferase [Bacteroidota bacterium]
MIFQTERLIVRQPTWVDGDHFYMLNSDPDIVRFIRPPRTREESDEKLKERIETNNAGGNGLGGWIVELKPGKTPAGFFALFQLPGNDEVHLGYSLLKPYWGFGYATELTIAGLDYSFNQLKLHRVIATTDPAHIASQKILLKAGFKPIDPIIEDGKEFFKFEIWNPSL